jgi:hypothetical protein
MFIKLKRDAKDKATQKHYKAGEILDINDQKAKGYITLGIAEPFGMRDLLNTLKIKTEPSNKLLIPTISDETIEEFRAYFNTRKDIKVSDLATMLLGVYINAKKIKDNKNLPKHSSDLLTIFRLVKFYDKTQNARK